MSITGSVDQELLRRHEDLVTDHRLRRHPIKGRLYLSDGERKTLAETSQKLAKQALEQVATLVKPENMLAWYRPLVMKTFDSSRRRKTCGPPVLNDAREALAVRLASEHRRRG